jgi:(S)-2-hydroxy-acid oxidase
MEIIVPIFFPHSQVGRPIIFGLAVDGEFGVRKTLQMLRDELELSMSLAGCCSIKDISRSHVQVGGDFRASRL